MEEDCVRAFSKVKPLCDSLVTLPTQKNVFALKNCIKKIPQPALQKLQGYIFFPLELKLMDNSVSTELKRHFIECLKELLLFSRVTTSQFFLKVYNQLFSLISLWEDPQNMSVAKVPEELKLSVIQCVKVLFISAMSDVVEAFYDVKNHAALAWGILICKKIAEEERMINLRIEALECILHMIQCNDEADKNDIVLRDSVKKLVKNVMPGIVSTAAHICRNPLLHHKIIQMGIRLWGCVVSLVMEDVDDEFDSSASIFEKQQSLTFIMLKDIIRTSETKTNKDKSGEYVKNKEWISKAAENLAGISKLIVKCQQNSHPYVRLELSIATNQILSCCSKSMEPSLSCLMECLIILSRDENEEVANYSVTALSKFSERYKSDSGKSFLENIEESFFSFLTRFPRIMLSAGVTTQLTLLSGYLSLLGGSLSQFLSLNTHLNRLIFSMINSVQIDVSGISLLADSSIRDVEDEKMYDIQWKKNVMFHGGETLLHLSRICSILREHIDVSILTHSLLDSMNEYQEYTNELLLILNELLTGGSGGSMVKHSSLIKEVLDFYLDLPVWPASEILNKSTEVAIRDVQKRVVQLCLAVEGIGKMPYVVGKEAFNPWLLQCLYAILEAAGSSLEVVAITGLEAVRTIACECADNNITVLIQNNTDYLTHHITRRLHHYHRHPGLLAVLSVIMRYSTVDVLPSLHEIISDVLQQSYDSFQMNNMCPYLQTFLTFISSIRSWSSCEYTEDIPKVSDGPIKKSPLDVLLEYKKSKDIIESMNSDEESDEEKPLEEKFSKYWQSSLHEKVDDVDDDKEQSVEEIKGSGSVLNKEVPIHIKLIIDILQRVLHFLPTKDSYQKILVLEVLNEGVKLLKSYPDKLLPVVHLIWSPLINRFQNESNEPLIMHRAFILLQTLASTSRDFIKMRTLKDVLPSICRFLREKAPESVLKDTKSAYRLTQQFKLQKCLLEGLGQLAVDVEFAEVSLHEIIESASPYLSSLQPQPLQNACIKLFMQIKFTSADLVWLHLVSLWSPTSVFKCPSTHLIDIQLPVLPDPDYRTNVQIILDSV